MVHLCIGALVQRISFAVRVDKMWAYNVVGVGCSCLWMHNCTYTRKENNAFSLHRLQSSSSASQNESRRTSCAEFVCTAFCLTCPTTIEFFLFVHYFFISFLSALYGLFNYDAEFSMEFYACIGVCVHGNIYNHRRIIFI
jgi:hypothetical protein